MCILLFLGLRLKEGIEMTNLDNLPVEIVKMILKMLPGEKLLKVKVVSKSWKILADDPLLMKRFYVSMDSMVNEEEFQRTITSKPSLIGISIEENHLTETNFKSMHNHPTLKIIKIKDSLDQVGNYFLPLYNAIYHRQAVPRQNQEAGGLSWPYRKPLVLCTEPASRVASSIDSIFKMRKSFHNELKKMKHKKV